MLYQLSYSRVMFIVAEAFQGVKAGRGSTQEHLLPSLVSPVLRPVSPPMEPYWSHARANPPRCAFPEQTYIESVILAGASYGYCASKHETFFGHRLHLVVTLGGVIVDFELTADNGDEREAAEDMLLNHPERAL